ncbi:hypothetical protein BDV97DRAFT_267442, partial [Delphinella strobiligena]
MVAHLHPRSRSTLSLFTTCLGISFLVVAAPHILPCPVDRRQFAEDGSSSSSSSSSDATRKRRRRKVATTDTEETTTTTTAPEVLNDEDMITRQRECPVPKPGGLLGQVMGFERQ